MSKSTTEYIHEGKIMVSHYYHEDLFEEKSLVALKEGDKVFSKNQVYIQDANNFMTIKPSYRGVIKYIHQNHCKVLWDNGDFGWIHKRYIENMSQARYREFIEVCKHLALQNTNIDLSIDTSHKDRWIQAFKDIEKQCSKPLPIWDHHAIKWRATLKPSEITHFVKATKEHQKRYPRRWYHKIGHKLSFTKSTQ